MIEGGHRLSPFELADTVCVAQTPVAVFVSQTPRSVVGAFCVRGKSWVIQEFLGFGWFALSTSSGLAPRVSVRFVPNREKPRARCRYFRGLQIRQGRAGASPAPVPDGGTRRPVMSR